MNTSISSILNTFDNKIKEMDTLGSEIVDKFNNENFIIDKSKLELLLSISQNLNIINDQLNE